MILIKPRDLEPVRVRPGAGRPRKEPAGAVKEAEA
jgi:hypothetical protein